jgi:hypothetical protein
VDERFETDLRAGYPDDASGVVLGSPMLDGEVLAGDRGWPARLGGRPGLRPTRPPILHRHAIPGQYIVVLGSAVPRALGFVGPTAQEIEPAPERGPVLPYRASRTGLT